MSKESKDTSSEHVAFYRKYRPQSFEKVLGQDHIVKSLKSAIESKNHVHAYLFAGSRGTGKTSIARILARELGCSSNDLYEIDAASNRGIDDIRELKESVQTLPFESPYKVYIIDEVHMLTKEAFNALLKTLEEPPKYVIFILATTEIHKLPETIVSRCQTFVFKKPTQKILKDLVVDVAESEGFKMEAGAGELIAILGDGSFRDTHGVLQKVLGNSGDKKITLEEVEKITGAPSGKLVNDYVLSALSKNIESGLIAVNMAAEQNIDMKIFTKLVLSKLRAALLVKFGGTAGKDLLVDVSEEDMKFLADAVKENTASVTSGLLVEYLNCYEQLDRSYLPQLPLELALVKIAGER